ncbi:MAG: phosphate signaling complex protein PhoU [Oscillospiraceae bacterium]|nr:phosphate signaling complex protein PhoU [Oscillospiraceae bacterium]
MRDNFAKQLDELYVSVKNMGILCEKAIEKSARTILSNDDSEENYLTLVKEVDDCEKEVDQKEREVENLCMRLLLHQQPVATDLRTVSSALKLISDMERIGDQASDITELSKYIRNCGLHHKLHLSEMFSETISLVKKAVDSFSNHDLDKAKQVIKDDDKIDGLFNKVKGELISIIKEDTDAELCIDLLMVAKYLERIGDHAVNIAEWVVYAIEGVHKDI